MLLRLAQALNGVQGPDAFFVYSGLVTDEWRSGDTFVQRNNQDQRIWEPTNTFNADPYRRLNRVRVEGLAAIKALRQYVADSVYLVGRMFALTSYVETLIGENYCNGTPLSGLDGTTIVYGQPLSNDSVLAIAIQNTDSALAQAALAPPRDSIQSRRVTRLASVVKGRALMDRGQFLAAAAHVTEDSCRDALLALEQYGLIEVTDGLASSANDVATSIAFDVAGDAGRRFLPWTQGTMRQLGQPEVA